jgi:MFS family permease
VAFALATAICYNSIMMIAFMCGIILCYTTVEVSIERTMDKVSDKRIRGTAISLAMTFCTIFTSSSIGLTGLIAQYASYQAAFIVITSIVIVLTLIVSFKLKSIDKI